MWFYADNWNPKLRLVRPSSTESTTVSVLNVDILFSVNWKNSKCQFYQRANYIQGPGARRILRSAQESEWPKVAKRFTTRETAIAGYAPFVASRQNHDFLIQN